MSLESEIYSRLSSTGALTAIVSNRIYPSVIPQNALYPAVAYQRISSQRESVMGTDTGDLMARVQFSLHGASFTGHIVPGVAALRAALQRYSGGSIQDCYIDGEIHDYDDELGLHRAVVDFLIWYKE